MTDQSLEIVPFRPEFESRVVDLIVGIQQREFGMAITGDEQPDLRRIPDFYQVNGGNFWVALCDEDVVGTIGLLDIGFAQGALRKMFVDPSFRGSRIGTATRLLATLLEWSGTHAIEEIFLGTTPHFHAAHRFYERNEFSEIAKSSLPAAFPIMEVDTKFYRRRLRAW
jgi:GNAT superfamily N-acetyltransferase